MKTLALTGILLSTLLMGATTHADSQPLPKTPARAKMTKLAKELSQYVVSLNKPVYVYNWFNARNRNAVWKTHFSSDEVYGLHHLENSGSVYFQAFCTNDPSVDASDCRQDDVTKTFGRGNMFGPGLYASTDPVATSMYGGGTDWVLMQMRLPKGLRFVSLVWRAKNDSLSDEAKKDLSEMCPSWSEWSAANALNRILPFANQNKGAAGTLDDKKCLAGLRQLLKDQLQIDALYYQYTAVKFEGCDTEHDNGAGTKVSGNTIRNAAFVITNASKFKASDVKVFNSQTTSDFDLRVQITSAFYKAKEVAGIPSPKIQATIDYYKRVGLSLPNFPNWTILSFASNSCMTTPYYNNVCGNWYWIRDPAGANTMYVPLDDAPADSPEMMNAFVPVVAATKISAANVPTAMKMTFGMMGMNNQLIWPDLEGVDLPADSDQWIKRSMLGCSDVAPFGAVPNLRYGRSTPRSEIPDPQ